MKKATKLIALAFIAVFAVVFLTACGNNIDEDLVGTWSWENNPGIQLTFEADGTGTWTGQIDSFDWEIRSGNIRMTEDGGRTTRTWSYEINGGTLTIRRTEQGFTDEVWVYVR